MLKYPREAVTTIRTLKPRRASAVEALFCTVEFANQDSFKKAFGSFAAVAMVEGVCHRTQPLAIGMKRETRMSDLITRLEAATEGSRELDVEIYGEILFPTLLTRQQAFNLAPFYTTSINSVRTLGGLLVFASDIGADGLPMVKLVFDTSTTPVIEYTGIAATLELAWCIAALKARENET